MTYDDNPTDPAHGGKMSYEQLQKLHELAPQMHRQLCSIASVEMDWMQRLVSGDEAMKIIGQILGTK